MAATIMEVHLGDEVRMRKPHPCGSTDWTVVRLGADIGLKCQTCGHRILLPRSQFERGVRAFLSCSVPGHEHPSPTAGSASSATSEKESASG